MQNSGSVNVFVFVCVSVIVNICQGVVKCEVDLMIIKCDDDDNRQQSEYIEPSAVGRLEGRVLRK